MKAESLQHLFINSSVTNSKKRKIENKEEDVKRPLKVLKKNLQALIDLKKRKREATEETDNVLGEEGNKGKRQKIKPLS